jgi:transmembrane sensor
MSKLVQLRSPRLVREEAANWLVSLEEGLSPDERVRLEAWLHADPAHRQALIRMAEHWDGFDELAELADILPLNRRSRRDGFALKLVAAAAAVLIVAAFGLYVVWKRGEHAGVEVASTAAPAAGTPSPSAAGAGSQTSFSRKLQTNVGEQLTVPLADGSVVTLNTNTALDVQYFDAERRITLNRGEAIFSVAHDAARPFRVHAGERVVQAVGTVFNVKLESKDGVRVTVTEGKVKVVDRPAAAQPELFVSAGESAVLSDAKAQIRRIESAQIEASQAWQRGVLIYQGETLDTVIADVSRYTNVRFSIADDSIRNKRVGGVFRAGDVDGLLLALRESFGIEPHREGDVIVLTARR